MKKLSLILLLLILIGCGAFAQQASSQPLFWVGGDFGWNGSSFGGGAHLDTGFLLSKGMYFDLVQDFFLSNNISLLFAAGIKIYPFPKGLMAEIGVGVGDVQTRNVDDWCFGSSMEVGYGFGWIVVGTKLNLYVTGRVQATLGLFVDLT